VPLEGERARRIITAILANVQNWEQRLIELEAVAIPGNKARILALMRDIRMFRVSLCRLAKMDGEAICDRPADDKPPDE
jgi:hypothetical protein